MSALPSDDVLTHIVDVHCHPTEEEGNIPDSVMDDLRIQICAMASRADDQVKVADLTIRCPTKASGLLHLPLYFFWLVCQDTNRNGLGFISGHCLLREGIPQVTTRKQMD